MELQQRNLPGRHGSFVCSAAGWQPQPLPLCDYVHTASGQSPGDCSAPPSERTEIGSQTPEGKKIHMFLVAFMFSLSDIFFEECHQFYDNLLNIVLLGFGLVLHFLKMLFVLLCIVKKNLKRHFTVGAPRLFDRGTSGGPRDGGSLCANRISIGMFLLLCNITQLFTFALTP